MIRGQQYTNNHDLDAKDTLRSAFSGTQGQQALNLILRWLGYFDIAIEREGMTLEEAIARRNFAIELLERMGIFHDENTLDVVEGMLKVDAKPHRPSATQIEEGDSYA